MERISKLEDELEAVKSQNMSDEKIKGDEQIKMKDLLTDKLAEIDQLNMKIKQL